jgi:transcriptional regulator with XRE-family HTH domain
MDISEIVKRIHDRMKLEEGWTEERLAQEFDVKISSIAKYKSGKRVPTMIRQRAFREFHRKLFGY